jgi:hypothetical protein
LLVVKKLNTYYWKSALWRERLIEGSQFLGFVAKGQNTHDNGDGDEDQCHEQTYESSLTDSGT